MVKRLSWEGWPRKQVRKDGHWPRRQVRKDGQHGMLGRMANKACLEGCQHVMLGRMARKTGWEGWPKGPALEHLVGWLGYPLPRMVKVAKLTQLWSQWSLWTEYASTCNKCGTSDKL